MRGPLVMTSVSLLMVLGCAPADQAPPEVDLQGERAALMQADRDWSEAQLASHTPVDVIAAQFLADAYLLAPNAPLIEGREAIQAVKN